MVSDLIQAEKDAADAAKTRRLAELGAELNPANPKAGLDDAAAIAAAQAEKADAVAAATQNQADLQAQPLDAFADAGPDGGGFFAGIGEWLAAAWEDATSWLNDAWDATTEWLGETWNATLAWTGEAVAGVGNWVAGGWNGLTDWWANSTFAAWWGGLSDSIGDSLGAIVTGWQAIFYDVIGEDTLAQQLYADAYANSPLGQTADSGGFFYWGTRISVGAATAATAAASYLIGAEVAANFGVYRLSVHAAQRIIERRIPNAAVPWGFQMAKRGAALESQEGLAHKCVEFPRKSQIQGASIVQW